MLPYSFALGDIILRSNSFQLTIKTTLFIFAIIIAVSIIFVNRLIINDLRNDLRNNLRHHHKSYSEAVNNKNTGELQYMMKILLPSLNVPIIITVENYEPKTKDDIYASLNLDNLSYKNSNVYFLTFFMIVRVSHVTLVT